MGGKDAAAGPLRRPVSRSAAAPAGRALVESLYGGVQSPVSSLDGAVKIVCLVGCVVAVVLTPPQQVWAFGLYAIVVLGAALTARIPLVTLGRRLLVETPFVVFAVVLPFIGTGPRTEVAGVSLSVAGCWAAWSILAKATLGVASSVVLAWSTPVADLLAGMERLRCPPILVAIGGFMIRYVDVVSGELHRLQIARISRGDDPRWLWQGRAVAATAGTVFVRSFERGERIQHAMLARGFDGTFPSTSTERTRAHWFPALLVPTVAAAVMVAANLAQW